MLCGWGRGQKLDASAFSVCHKWESVFVPAVASFLPDYTRVREINVLHCVEPCFLYRLLEGLASRCGPAPSCLPQHIQSASGRTNPPEASVFSAGQFAFSTAEESKDHTGCFCSLLFLLLLSSTITKATRGRVYLGSWSRVIRAHHHHGREVWQQADMVAELLRAHISKGKKQRAHWEWHRLLKPPSPPLVKLFPTRLPCCLLGPPRQLYQLNTLPSQRLARISHPSHHSVLPDAPGHKSLGDGAPGCLSEAQHVFPNLSDLGIEPTYRDD